MDLVELACARPSHHATIRSSALGYALLACLLHFPTMRRQQGHPAFMPLLVGLAASLHRRLCHGVVVSAFGVPSASTRRPPAAHRTHHVGKHPLTHRRPFPVLLPTPIRASSTPHRVNTYAKSRGNGPISRLFATTTDTDISDLRRTVSDAKDLTERNAATCPSITVLENQVADLERETSDPSFWDDPNSPRTKQVNDQLGRSNRLLARRKRWEELLGECTAALSLLDELREAGEDDEDTIEMIMEECQTAAKELLDDGKLYELESLLSGPYDDRPARMLLTAGGGRYGGL